MSIDKSLRRKDSLQRARNERTGEEKYFVCGGAEEAPLGLRLRVGFARWNVEHALRVSKSELGFRHFEGRSYVALMRHLTLCLVSLGFAAEHTQRLRGGKGAVDDGAGVPGAGGSVPLLAAAATGDR